VVEVYVLLTGGVIPNPDGPEIADVTEAISGKKVRPLTDQVKVGPPEAVPLDYTVTYFITSQQAGFASAIDTDVRNANAAYGTWQKGKIGRDINPDELIRGCRAAGAKRVLLTRVLARDEDGNVTDSEPLAFTPLTRKQEVQIPDDYDRVIFGGVEDE
jgi:phage-related baseplate assembly protein